ncbi:type II toxin-antitoxin system RelE/ParE family toxin [Xenorhabdus sp. Vera]|uniref:type II toxin-antitoxin system RelE/ParE family toxin n=1 Tax=Xenorhabdus koppenhoeferi TaxID=351659 RepID=UPI0019A0C73E|nr:type II toxin-antitoxin system RelE/ParE family toxin [Xenorhabdus sp. Vera]MBD2810850.1 type II toxin-antitoxin system RelE/ParE family toxin [Xenorhabdus sp. Vera]
MSEEQKNDLQVYETRRFAKALSKLPENLLSVVEDEIEKIIDNPEIGELKKGDFAFLQVHKFLLNSRLALMGYCWKEEKIELYLLDIEPHENFYQEQKRHRKMDLKLIR